MRWATDERVDEGKNVGLSIGNEVCWMYEVGWRGSEGIGERNGVGLPRDLPAGKQLEGRREGWQSGSAPGEREETV